MHIATSLQKNQTKQHNGSKLSKCKNICSHSIILKKFLILDRTKFMTKASESILDFSTGKNLNSINLSFQLSFLYFFIQVGKYKNGIISLLNCFSCIRSVSDVQKVLEPGTRFPESKLACRKFLD